MATTRRILFLLAALFLYLYGSHSRAASMSDLWWNPNESGWGVNLIQQQDIIFATLFVYSPSGQPTWYVGSNMTLVSSSSTQRTFTGGLYTTTGPWFGTFFNPNAVGVRQVGNITFVANSPFTGTLTYTIDGVSLSKAIQRQTWRHITLGGTYYGAIDLLDGAACGNTGANLQPFNAIQAITATVNSNGLGGAITMTITDPNGVSTFSGSYTQYGSIYAATGTLVSGGMSVPAAINDFSADDDGIRGNLLAQVPGGCVLNLRFAAVRPG
ncbi:hypothetical protein BWI17_17275 [Betaproteobacteria bacterium GR16-43]|nr:hypothetical protein BWI17_17275 [Betaproteobacteria bacterium GR16-43]